VTGVVVAGCVLGVCLCVLYVWRPLGGMLCSWLGMIGGLRMVFCFMFSVWRDHTCVACCMMCKHYVLSCTCVVCIPSCFA